MSARFSRYGCYSIVRLHIDICFLFSLCKADKSLISRILLHCYRCYQSLIVVSFFLKNDDNIFTLLIKKGENMEIVTNWAMISLKILQKSIKNWNSLIQNQYTLVLVFFKAQYISDVKVRIGTDIFLNFIISLDTRLLLYFMPWKQSL